MRSKILIIVPYLGVGGTISSLNAFLECVDPTVLMVHIFARRRTGAYLYRLPNCKILDENVFLSSRLYKSNIILKATNTILVGMNFLLSYVGLSIIPLLCKFGGRKINSLSYDAVFSYQEDLCSVLSYLPAKKRVGWIRSEYTRYLSLNNNVDETKYYKRINTVVAVSDFAKRSFLNVHPWHPHVVTINNFMNIEIVREKAEDKSSIDPQFVKGDFTIVSIGRLDPVKQFDVIPGILRSVIDRTQKDIRWYIIGGSRKGGSDSELKIKQDIASYKLQGKLVLLPETSNPYAYMAEADLFVHTSISETYSRVVAEAKSVGTPVVVNNFEAAYEFVKDGEEGIIVQIDNMAEAIYCLVNDTAQYLRFKQNLATYSWHNDIIMEQTLSII